MRSCVRRCCPVGQDVTVRGCAGQRVEVYESAGLAPLDDPRSPNAYLPSNDPFVPARDLQRTSHAAPRPSRTAGPSPLRASVRSASPGAESPARTVRVLHPPRLRQGFLRRGRGDTGAGGVDAFASKAGRSRVARVARLRLGQLVCARATGSARARWPAEEEACLPKPSGAQCALRRRIRRALLVVDARKTTRRRGGCCW